MPHGGVTARPPSTAPSQTYSLLRKEIRPEGGGGEGGALKIRSGEGVTTTRLWGQRGDRDPPVRNPPTICPHPLGTNTTAVGFPLSAAPPPDVGRTGGVGGGPAAPPPPLSPPQLPIPIRMWGRDHLSPLCVPPPYRVTTTERCKSRSLWDRGGGGGTPISPQVMGCSAPPHSVTPNLRELGCPGPPRGGFGAPRTPLIPGIHPTHRPYIGDKGHSEPPRGVMGCSGPPYSVTPNPTALGAPIGGP